MREASLLFRGRLPERVKGGKDGIRCRKGFDF
jgi:hypothetical protein